MFRIDVSSRQPIYEQLCASAEQLISAGVLKPGDSLPSVRKLAIELSVNPNTIQRAYTDMCRKGYVCAVAGKGCFVAENAVEIIKISSTVFDEFNRAAQELAKCGVDKAQMIDMINDIFKGGNELND